MLNLNVTEKEIFADKRDGKSLSGRFNDYCDKSRPKDRIVSTTTGLEVNEKGLLVTNTFGETTRDGIFASGDVVAVRKRLLRRLRIQSKLQTQWTII